MNYTRYNTTIHIPFEGDEIQLLNELATVIARTDVVTKELIWSHKLIDASQASELTRDHHERMIEGTHSRLTAHYDNFLYRSVFHAMAAAISMDSPLHDKLENAYEAVKRMDGFIEHMKVSALNPRMANVGSCSYCERSCRIEDMALISIAVPIVARPEANIHGQHGIAINPVCSSCAEDVEVA